MKRKLKAGASLRIFGNLSGLTPEQFDCLNAGKETEISAEQAERIADKLAPLHTSKKEAK